MRIAGGHRNGANLREIIMPPAIATALLMALSGCVAINVENSGNDSADHADAHDYPEARSYTVSDNPQGEVDAALTRAAQNDTRMLLVMGANWCHDSRALAGWLGTERFQDLVANHYELVFVNIGLPQTGDGHNLDIAHQFGLEELPGSPNVLVVTPEGLLVNPDTATTWRNAASRSEDQIYDELFELAHRPLGIKPVEGIEIAQ